MGGDLAGDLEGAWTFRRQHLIHQHRHLGHRHGIHPADASGEFRTEQAALVAVDLAIQELRIVVCEVADPSGPQRITEGEAFIEKPHLLKGPMLQDLPGDRDSMDESSAGTAVLTLHELQGNRTVWKGVLGAEADHGLKGVQDLQDAHPEVESDWGGKGRWVRWEA